MAYLLGTDGQELEGADGQLLTDGVPFTDLVVGKTIVSQYQAGPVVTAMIQNFSAWIDPSTDIDNFYDYMWNIATAQGYGLDVWGRIVGVNRVVNVTSAKYFGYEEATTVSADPYNQSPFYTGQPTTSNYALSDDAYRNLILAKAMANICDGSIPAINQVLLNLFPGRGDCYCTDGLDGTMTYTFNFPLAPSEIAIVSQSGVLPTPAGIVSSIVIL